MKLNTTLLLCSLLLITACKNEKPEFESEPVTTATEDTLYSYTVEATDKDGDDLSYSVTKNKALPPWLSLSPGFGTEDIFVLPTENTELFGQYAYVDGMVSDSKGNIYFSTNDYSGNRRPSLYKLSPGGNITKLYTDAGSGISGFYNLSLEGSKLYFNTTTVLNGRHLRIGVIDLSNTAQGWQTAFDIQNSANQAFAIRAGYIYSIIYSGNREIAVIKQKLDAPEDKKLLITRSAVGFEPTAIGVSPSNEIYMAFFDGQLKLETGISRYKANLTLDTSFGVAGTLTIPGQPWLTSLFHFDNKGGFYLAAVDFSRDTMITLKFNKDATAPFIVANGAVAITLDNKNNLLIATNNLPDRKISRLVKQLPVLSGTPTQADIGEHKIDLTVSDGKDTDTQTFTITVQNVNDAPVGGVVIRGQAKPGASVTADVSSLSDEDGFDVAKLQYQWLRDNTAIAGATQSGYTLTEQDIGKSVTVEVRYTDNYATAERVTSEAIIPLPEFVVVVQGRALQGETLSGSTNFAQYIAGISFQWYRNGIAIEGANDSSYTLTQTDVGATITVRANYADGAGSPKVIVSVPSETVENINDPVEGAVLIAGKPDEYATLTATANITDPDGVGSLTYSWFAHINDAKTPLATSAANTYTLATADIGKTISVTVSYTDGFGFAESIDSLQTVAVANTNDAPTGSVSLAVSNNNYMEGETLTAVATIADKDGMTSSVLSYQWLANGAVISGATNISYTLTAAEVDKTLSVRVSYVDDYGSAELMFSPETPKIAAIPASFSNVDLANIGTGNGGIVISGVGFPLGAIGDAIASGDVNGDGYIDLILGAPRDNFDDGVVYVVFGPADGISSDIDVADIGAGVAGFKITGAAGIRSQLGFNLAFVPDMNGDGKGEIIVAAPGIVDGSFNPLGGSYVIFGKSGNATISIDTLVADNAGFAIVAGANDRLLGSSVAAAADVNGDTVPDVIVGAYGSDNANGAAYVVFGKSSSTAVDVSQLALTSLGFALKGEFLANAGYSVASIGDINADGKADIMVSAPDDPMDSTTQGHTYVVFGKTDSAVINLADIVAGGANDAGGFVISGEKDDDFSGDWVSAVGDVNADGMMDFAIAASFFSNDGGITRPGRAYVIYGRSGMSADISLTDIANGNGGFIINADVADNIHLGSQIVAAGDVNSDGFDDMLVGAFGTEPSTAKGAAYVVFGKDNTAAVSVTELTSEAGGYQIIGVDSDLAGRAVAFAGDINADGKADLAVGAPGNFKVYIVFGK
jgi:hypothetical protein